MSFNSAGALGCKTVLHLPTNPHPSLLSYVVPDSAIQLQGHSAELYLDRAVLCCWLLQHSAASLLSPSFLLHLFFLQSHQTPIASAAEAHDCSLLLSISSKAWKSELCALRQDLCVCLNLSRGQTWKIYTAWWNIFSLSLMLWGLRYTIDKQQKSIFICLFIYI